MPRRRGCCTDILDRRVRKKRRKEQRLKFYRTQSEGGRNVRLLTVAAGGPAVERDYLATGRSELRSNIEKDSWKEAICMWGTENSYKRTALIHVMCHVEACMGPVPLISWCRAATLEGEEDKISQIDARVLAALAWQAKGWKDWWD